MSVQYKMHFYFILMLRLSNAHPAQYNAHPQQTLALIAQQTSLEGTALEQHTKRYEHNNSTVLLNHITSQQQSSCTSRKHKQIKLRTLEECAYQNTPTLLVEIIVFTAKVCWETYTAIAYTNHQQILKCPNFQGMARFNSQTMRN